jgi:aspartate 1-decarboxylase
METVINENEFVKVNYEIETSLEVKENLINEFKGRLLCGGYKVILYNGQVPILEDDTRLVDYIIECLEESTLVELSGDILTIHMKNEIVTLTGYEQMSDYEISARNYLFECGDEFIIKDDIDQVETIEDNFKDSKDYYSKCNQIINIEDFSEYDKESSIYKMNWDAIWVEYSSGVKELWQRP